jgi:hypothetical protein
MRNTSDGSSANKISSPGVKNVSIPSQRSETIGIPQAAASNRRTLGLKPAAIISRRVTFNVKRLAP